MQGHSPFARFAWGVVAYNLLVIVWGAFVRATGSGAGCGSHWPLCNGEVVPRPERIETLIEFSHRLSSALDGFLVLALVVWAWRAFPPGDPARRPVRWGAVVSLVLLVNEALIGAGLVRYELVADNASAARALVICAHLVNTFFLLASLALTAHWAAGGAPPRRRAAPGEGGERGKVGWLLALGVAALLALGMSGAVTALGDTLFPAGSLGEGMRRDFTPGAHFLLRLRVFHPALAIGLGIVLAVLATAVARRRPGAEVQRWARRFTALFAAQVVVGFVNLALAAPVALQLVHLLFADLVWIGWVLLAGAAAGESETSTAGAGLGTPIGQADLP